MRIGFRSTIIGAVLAIAASALPSAAFADSFGAIAYSGETGAIGWSYDHPSRRRAERAAMDNCDAGDCKVLWFKNACGAVAVGPDGGWGSGWGNNRRRAEREAVNSCSNHSSGCSVIRWQCSGAN